MTAPTRHPAFNPKPMPPALDPCPHALTPEERSHILDTLRAGSKPNVRTIRKLLRLCDERLEIIRHLERKRG